MRQIPGALTRLRVVVPNAAATRGRLVAAGLSIPCAIGRRGLTRRKREGDGASPAGRHRILFGYYRPDAHPVRPHSRLPLRPMRRNDGWGDAPGASSYNRPVRLPHPAGHEALWRADGLYDVVLVMDWNIRPRAMGRGSAIFFHLARPDFAPTAGCVAVTAADMRRLLARLRPGATIALG